MAYVPYFLLEAIYSPGEYSNAERLSRDFRLPPNMLNRVTFGRVSIAWCRLHERIDQHQHRDRTWNLQTR